MFYTLEDKIMAAIPKVLAELEASKAHTAVKYLSDKLVIRATRPMYGPKGKKRVERGGFNVVLTIGKPNYQQRQFIKLCKKAKEPFPVKLVQLKYPTKKK